MGNSFVEAQYKDPGYAEAKRRSKEINTNAYDSEIAAGMNKSSQAGAVQGVGNPGGLAADTYAEMSDNKARRTSAIEDQYNNYELQHKAAFYDEQARAKQQFEMNKPGFMDWLGFGVSTLGSIASIPVGGAGGSVLGTILGAGKKLKNPNKTNYGSIQSTFVPPPQATVGTDKTTELSIQDKWNNLNKYSGSQGIWHYNPYKLKDIFKQQQQGQ